MVYHSGHCEVVCGYQLKNVMSALFVMCFFGGKRIETIVRSYTACMLVIANCIDMHLLHALCVQGFVNALHPA